jgi:hypothetical protein
MYTTLEASGRRRRREKKKVVLTAALADDGARGWMKKKPSRVYRSAVNPYWLS